MSTKKYLYILDAIIVLAILIFIFLVFTAKNKTNQIIQNPTSQVSQNNSQPSGESNLNENNTPTAAVDTVPGNTGEVKPENIASDSSSSTNQSEKTSFSFAEIGDTQSFSTNPNGNLEKATRSLSGQQIDFVIATGDLVHSCDGGSSCDSKYSSWKAILGSLASKSYAVQGNHDRTSRIKSDSSWSRSFNFPTNGPDGYKDFVYSFDYENSHFIALDSEKPKGHIIDDAQRRWLEQDLSRNTKENIFVFFHEPAFQMCQDPDSLGDKPSERDALWNILKKHKVTAVFNGHCHMFARKVQDGIHEFVLGDTDSTADDLLQPGMTDFGLTGGHYFAIISVSGKQIDYKLYSVDGNLLQEYKF